MNGLRVSGPLASMVGTLACALGVALFVVRVEPLGVVLSRCVAIASLVALVVLASLGVAAVLDAAVSRVLDQPRSAIGAHGVIVGAPLFGTACFLVALVSTAPAVLGVTLVMPAVHGALVLWRARPRPPSPVTLDVAGLSAGALLAVAFALEWVIAQLPPTSLDELAYHLRVPKAWVVAGRFIELPLNSHSYFPLGVEAAALPLLALAGPLGGHAARLLHWVIAVLVTIVMARWLARRLWLSQALVACVVWVSAPCLWLATGLALIEWNLIGVCLLVVLCFESWVEGRESHGAPIALAWAAGVATKYTFLPFAAVVGLTGLWCLRGRPRDARAWLASGVVGLLLGAPFLVRNLVLTGNPIEPLGSSDGGNVLAFVADPGLSDRLLRYVFDPSRVDESLGAAVPCAALCGLWGAWTLRRDYPLAWLVPPMAALAIGLGYLGVVGRILLPFLLVPVVVGLTAILSGVTRSSIARTAVMAGWLFVVAAQFATAASFVAAQEPYAYFFSDGEPHTTKRRAYAGFRWLDAQLPPESKTLVIGMLELYPSNRNVHGGGNSDGGRVARYLDARSVDELWNRLVRDGFTHAALYIPRVQVAGAARPTAGDAERIQVLDERQAALLRELLERRTTVVASHDGWSLHRLSRATFAPAAP